jgi:hypothetical protein
MRCGGGGSICSIQSDEAISAQCDETTNTGEQRSSQKCYALSKVARLSKSPSLEPLGPRVVNAR